MADVNFGAAIGQALQAGAELVALAGGVERIEHLAQRRANEILRNLGPVLGPVGLHDADVDLVLRQREAVFQPEIAHRIPELFYRALHHQPALIAIALDAHVAHAVGCCLAVGRLDCLARFQCVGRHHAAGHGIACVARELLEVGRHFQRLALGGAFVVDLVALQHRAGRQRNGQAEQAKSDSIFHAENPLEFEKAACAAIRAGRWRAVRLRQQPRGPC